MSGRGYQARVGQEMGGLAPRATGASRTVFWVIIAVIGVFAALGFAGFIWYAVGQSGFVRTITGVPAKGGEITEIGGTGISIDANIPAGILTIKNDGVVTVSGVSSDAAGALTLSSSQGITVTPAPGSNTIDLKNDGIITLSGSSPTSTGELTLIGGLGTNIVPGVNQVTVNSEAILAVSGVGPTAGGDITLAAGQGVSVTPSPGTNTITVANSGVLTISTVSPTAAGELNIAGGTGITAVPVPLSNSVVLDNDGVLSLTPLYEMTTSATTGAINIYRQRDYDTIARAYNDPLGADIDYQINFGGMTPIAENVWRMGVNVGFYPYLLPGPISGEDGQGNTGSQWIVPATGRYAVNLHCEVQITSITAGDFHRIHGVLTLGSTTLNPSASGYIPPGASTSTDLSTATLGPGIVNPRFSLNAMFQACPTCLIHTGDVLAFHFLHEHAGIGPAAVASLDCRLHVARTI